MTVDSSIRDKVAAAMRPHLGHQEYLGDAVWRCPCDEVWTDGIQRDVAEAMAEPGRISDIDRPDWQRILESTV